MTFDKLAERLARSSAAPLDQFVIGQTGEAHELDALPSKKVPDELEQLLPIEGIAANVGAVHLRVILEFGRLSGIES